MRISTSLRALCCQSGLAETFATPTIARRRWIKVPAYVAALDCALHERAKRFMNLGVGSLEHLFGVSHKRIQHRGGESGRTAPLLQST